ncbi:MAG: M23 family metallopeptidase [Firmicutes bacterium]|nr:M23 family metallopeptidase [Bacillota bacterium]
MAQKKRTKPRSFTLLLVPNGRAQVKSFRLPRWVLGITSGVLVGLILVLGYLTYVYITVADDLGRIQSLQAENRRQAMEIEELHRSTEDIRGQIEAVVQLERELRQLIGVDMSSELPTKPVSRSNRGRPPRPNNSDESEAAQIETGTNSEVPLNLSEIRRELSGLKDMIRDEYKNLTLLKNEVINKQDVFLAVPNRWPINGRVTSEFGYRRSPFGIRKEFHSGLDIAAAYGTKVSAAGAGIVTFAGWRPDYGRMITIDHGNGYVTHYAHNSRLLVKEGEHVQKGQAIAEVGNSGRSTGPHLHFMLELNGSLTDPLTVLYP